VDKTLVIAALFLDKKGTIDKISSYWQGDTDEIFEILSDKKYWLFRITKANRKARYAEGLYGYIAWLYYSLSIFGNPCRYQIQTYLFGTKVQNEIELLDSIFIPLQKKLKNLHAEKTIRIYRPNETVEIFLTPKLDNILIDYSR